MTREGIRAPAADRRKETFDDFFEEQFERITRFVARRLSNPSDVEDVVSRVFIDAHKGWRKCRGDRGLWLLAIARRRVADFWRRGIPVDLPLTIDVPQSTCYDQAELIAARQMLDTLPDLERDVVLLQALDGLSIRDIATVIGRSEVATNSLLERARRRLRQIEEKS